MANLGDAERHIALLISASNRLSTNGLIYSIKWFCKTPCKKGESKTEMSVKVKMLRALTGKIIFQSPTSIAVGEGVDVQLFIRFFRVL